MKPYNDPKHLVKQITKQFSNLQQCGCYDVDASETICLSKKGNEFSTSDIEAYIEIFVLADSEQEEEYVTHFDYGDCGFVAIKKLNQNIYLFMAGSCNTFPYVLIFLNNFEMMTKIPPNNKGVFDSQYYIDNELSYRKEHLQAAKQIQSLVLSDKNILKNYSSDFFLYYSPQEIIGGDFYIFIDFGDVLYVIVADCTGHSVEGALATMAVSSIINQTITSDTQDVRRIINDIYDKIDKYNENKEAHNAYGLGVELAICKIKKESKVINVASSGVTIIHQSDKKQKVINAKHSFDSNNRAFQYENLTVKGGDLLALCTDGIIHQFDKEDEHKLGKKGINQMLLDSFDNANISESSFLTNFNNWKGNTPQLDDQTLLCLML